MPRRNITRSSCREEDVGHLYSSVCQSRQPAIKRPRLESRPSRKRLFFHSKIFNYLKTIKIHDIVLDDPKVKVREIAKIVSISTECVVNILHTHLCMRKLYERWVPRLLTIDQKRIHMTISARNLAYFNRNPKEFLRRFVTMDETWIHHCTPDSREGSKQQVKPGESAPKRPKPQQSAGKVMVSVFWDAHGVIFINYLEKGRTITGAYYAALLDRLVYEIRKKRPHLKQKKIFFHDVNAPSHTSNVAQPKKHKLGFKSLPHPPYSPDLAPSDYYLFILSYQYQTPQ